MRWIAIAALVGCAPSSLPPARPAPRDPLAELAPDGQVRPYDVDRAIVDGVPLRDHYPFAAVITDADVPAAEDSLRRLLEPDFTVNWLEVRPDSVGLDLTPRDSDQELIPHGATSDLSRLRRLTAQLMPWCAGTSNVRWTAPQLEKGPAPRVVDRRGWTGADGAFALIEVHAVRATEGTAVMKPWRIHCNARRAEAVRRLAAGWLDRAEMLVHPALVVTESEDRRFGEYKDPCAKWRARGHGCDPIYPQMLIVRHQLPRTRKERALTLADVRSARIQITPLVHFGCDGTIRFIARFEVANPTVTTDRMSGAEIEQVTTQLEMDPIVLDLLTGERLATDLETAMVLSLASGGAIGTFGRPCGTPTEIAALIL
jgi:hypothetical protein